MVRSTRIVETARVWRTWTQVMLLAASLQTWSCTSKVIGKGSTEEGGAGAPEEASGDAGSSLASGSSTTAGQGGGGTTSGGQSASSATTPTSAGPTTGAGGSGADANTSASGGPSTTATGGGGETDGGGTCSNTCVPPVPDGWRGPVISFQGESPPDCPADYPELAFDAGDTIVMTGDCACTCSAPQMTCEQLVLRVGHGDDTCSSGLQPVEEIAALTCQANSVPAISVRTNSPDVACADGFVTNELQADFTHHFRACAGASEPGSCAAGTCVPAPAPPFEQRYCIYREGEFDCPTAYPNRLQLYDDFEDNRSCPSTCECRGGGGTCVAAADFYSDPGGTCASSSQYPVETLSISSAGYTCVSGSKPAYRIREVEAVASYGDEDPAACSPSIPPPMGVSTRTDPLTLCCVNE